MCWRVPVAVDAGELHRGDDVALEDCTITLLGCWLGAGMGAERNNNFGSQRWMQVQKRGRKMIDESKRSAIWTKRTVLVLGTSGNALAQGE